MNKTDIFAAALVDDVAKIYSAHMKVAIDTQQEFANIGSDKEKYLKEVFVNYMTIKNAIDNLKFIEIYLSIDPIPEHYLENGIDEIEYYRHHIESFHIKCASIIDYITLLLNHTLRLGIPKRKCNVYSITENTILKGSELITKLKALENEFKELKSNRNKIIHQGDFESESIKDIDSTLINGDGLFDFGEVLTEYLKNEKKEKILKTIENLNEQISKIEFHLGEILEQLTPYIQEKISHFEINEK
ncbi:Cthe_2314 family HEPN domain-containing protein [Tenacibaculum aiptasiae]|uniref:Cthe_2314 family HEPN domain-containing protein n=1 Tax=Tenacibaculum aiptasiae TaxID=426481 RepID=UPI00232A9A45|nr:Cthe_2314 family HEPN domain-containing protein [Tenacibaculum aiptasiae]